MSNHLIVIMHISMNLTRVTLVENDLSEHLSFAYACGLDLKWIRYDSIQLLSHRIYSLIECFTLGFYYVQDMIGAT